MDEWIRVIVEFIAGATTGSFLALVITRYIPGCSARNWFAQISWPASHCSFCKTTLSPRDLIPLYSWLKLRGCCRHCGHSIPATLFLVELFTALVFIVADGITDSPSLFFWLLLLSIMLLVLSEIDRRHLLLPDVLTLPLLISGMLFQLQRSPANWSGSVTGAAAGYLSFLSISFIYFLCRKQQGLGLGDAKLFAALGAWTGILALPLIAALAAVFGIAGWLYSAARAQTQKTIQQPFGPYLAVAGWLVFTAQHYDVFWLTILM
ncbi:hypothetical protein ED28_11300 [[Pantoea] beijingensis]|uniref:Prepilin leader peptidase/N-methyltransferase n=1 Tax=[Pantoea] beijingensis TaxID=1324864 RepID=A0A443ICF6_9GAMM|nr:MULTISPECIES: A24 family peptidase [Erwiniaceae]RWR01804.1 hypothetical protein ED28_11300 [[Pantoea] beijingensis]